jgi:protein SCO1/2
MEGPLMAALIMLMLTSSAFAQQPRMWKGGPDLTSRPASENTTPQLLSNVGIDQHLDQQLPMDAQFTDETGKKIKLGDLFGKRPIMLAFVYFECPMLCTEVLNGLTAGLLPLDFSAGKDFDVVAISFNPKDSFQLAALKKKNYVNRYHRAGSEAGWHFLTGDSSAIGIATRAAGFRYVYDSISGQYAHASGVILTTPEGKISKYFFGIEYAPKELKYALMEASNDRIGTITDKFLLFCYHYDPMRTKNGATIVSVIRFSGLATLVALGMLFVVLHSIRKKRLLAYQLEGTGVVTSPGRLPVNTGGIA